MKKQNNTSTIISLVLVMAILMGGFFWLKPNWDEASALDITLKSRQTDKQTVEAELQKLKDAQTTLDQGSEINRETVLAAIPDKFSQDQLINQITDLTKKYDIAMSSISFSVPVNSNEVIKKASLNVSMTSSEGDFLSFLSALENNARKLVVKNITVQFGSSGDLKRVNFNVSMETYFQGSL